MNDYEIPAFLKAAKPLPSIMDCLRPQKSPKVPSGARVIRKDPSAWTEDQKESGRRLRREKRAKV